MKSEFFKKSISVFLCFSFVVAEVTSLSPKVFAQTSPVKDSFKDIKNSSSWIETLPPELGEIVTYCIDESCVNASSQDAPLVLHIQDVHSNPEAQETIRKTLYWLKEKAVSHNHPFSIALEGASGSIHPEYFDFFPDYPQAGQAVVDHLFEKGEITGAEKFAWEEYLDKKNPDTSLFGVETYSLYQKNLAAYQAVATDKNIAQNLEKQKMLLQKNLSNLSNRPLKKFLQSKIELRDGHHKSILSDKNSQENWQEYFPVLRKESMEVLQIDLMNAAEKSRFPNLFRLARLFDLQKQPALNSETASQEWVKVLNQTKSWEKNQTDLNQLFEAGQRNGYLKLNHSSKGGAKKSLRKNLESLELLYTAQGTTTAGFKAFWQSVKPMVWSEEISFDGISSEMDLLEDVIFRKLAVSENDKQLVEDWKSFSQIKKLLQLELSEQNYRELKKEKQYLEEQVSKWGFNGLETSYQYAIQFYEAALERDHALIENTLTQAKKLIEAKQLNRRPLVVLISGGFHSAGLESVMKSKNIPHLVLRPHFSSVEKTGLYEKVMSGEGSTIKSSKGKTIQFSSRQQGLLYKSFTEVAIPWMLENSSHKSKEEIVQRGITNGVFWKTFFDLKQEAGLDGIMTLQPKGISAVALVPEIVSGEPGRGAGVMVPIVFSSGGGVAGTIYRTEMRVAKDGETPFLARGKGTPSQAVAYGYLARYIDHIPEALIYQVRRKDLRAELGWFRNDFLVSFIDEIEEEDWNYLDGLADPIIKRMEELLEKDSSGKENETILNPVAILMQKVEEDRHSQVLSPEHGNLLMTKLREKALASAHLYQGEWNSLSEDEQQSVKEVARHQLEIAREAYEKVSIFFKNMSDNATLESAELIRKITDLKTKLAKPAEGNLTPLKEELVRLEKLKAGIDEGSIFYSIILQTLKEGVHDSFLKKEDDVAEKTVNVLVTKNRSLSSLIYEKLLVDKLFPNRRRIKKQFKGKENDPKVQRFLAMPEEMIKAVSFFLSTLAESQGYSSETFTISPGSENEKGEGKWVLYLDKPLGIAEVHRLWSKYGQNISAIVSTAANLSSHWVLIMKNFKHPPVITVLSQEAGASFNVKAVGSKVIVSVDQQGDADVTLRPTEDAWQTAKSEKELTDRWHTMQQDYAKTPTEIPVMANLVPSEQGLDSASGDGSGLVRTESLGEKENELLMEYIDVWGDADKSERLESLEGELLTLLKNDYEALMQAPFFKEKKITFRTFDFASDKNRELVSWVQRKTGVQDATSFNFYSTEVGKRLLALQLFAFSEALRSYKAFRIKEMRVMFPMIRSTNDLNFLLEKVEPLVLALGKKYAASLGKRQDDENPPRDFSRGIMVETLDAVKSLDDLLSEKKFPVQFISVGTNDLVKDDAQKEYGIDLDRDSPLLIKRFETLGPRTLLLLDRIVASAHKKGEKDGKKFPVCFCGNLAAQPKFLLLLEQYRRKYAETIEFSVSVGLSSVGPVKFFMSLLENQTDETLGELVQDPGEADQKLGKFAAALIESSDLYKQAFGEKTARSEIRMEKPFEMVVLPPTHQFAGSYRERDRIGVLLGEELVEKSQSPDLEVQNYLGQVLGQGAAFRSSTLGPDIHIRLDRVPKAPAIWEPLLILVQSVKGRVFFNLGPSVDLGKFDLFKKKALEDLSQLGFQVDENRWNIVQAAENAMPSAGKTNKVVRTALLAPSNIVGKLQANKETYRFRLDSTKDEALLVEQLVSIVHALALKSQLPDNWMEIQDPTNWANVAVINAVQKLTAYLKTAVSA